VYSPGTAADGQSPSGTLATNQLISTSLGGDSHQGEWVSIELPKKIKLEKLKVIGSTRLASGITQFPKDVVVAVSETGLTGSWSALETATLISQNVSNHSDTINITTQTSYYKYFALIVKSINSTATYSAVEIAELEFYGYEEGSGSLDTTLKTVYNVPATTGTQLEVYYDAKETSSYSGSGTTVNDLAGTQQNGTFNGGFDSTYKAFTFNGTSQNMTTTLANSGTPSAYAHTFAFWTKPISNLANHIQQAFLQLGTHSANSCSALRLEESTGLFRWFFHSNDIVYSADHIKIGEWNHIVAAYDGGSELTSRRIWVNDKEIYHTTTSGTIGALSLSANALLAIGSQDGGSNWNNGLNGSIANFRLYSKVLNADQVKELYDYQKDYFLGSKSQVTLYKGHLGVGVTEPSGQLELAGDERIQEYPPRALTGYETLVEGHGVFCVDFANWYSGNTPWGMYKKNNDVGGQENVWYGPYQNNNGYSGGNVYTGTDFAASTTSGLFLDDVDGTRYYGAWTTIAMPYDIYLKQIHIHQGGSSVGSSTSCAPEDGVILGSNDGTKWYHVHTFTGLQYGGTAGTSSYSAAGEGVVVNAKRPYSHYALITTRTHHNDFTVIIGELRWFGTPGPTTLDKGSLTLGRSLDVPRVSRYDVDTETPRPEKIVLDFDTTVNSSPTDISGEGNHGAFVGNAQYSASDKAFTGFPSSSSNYIKATLNGASGAYAHTQSYWINGADTTPRVAFTVGTNTGTYSYLYMWLNTSKWVMSVDGFGFQYVETIDDNRWYHITVTYDGGSVQDSYKFYLNGEYKTPTSVDNASSFNSLNLPSNPEVRIGRDDNVQWYNGMVSNPKVYSVALEPSEVRKLYRLGRTGRSMVISDTAVGIGKVPEAQLDVRGNLRVDGDILASVPYYAARQRAINSQATNRGIVYDAYVYTNYPGSFVRNSNTDGYYQPPRNGMYQVYMECIASGSGNVNIQRRTGTTVNINHCDRHWNYSQGGWDSVSASALIPITDCTTQNIRIYVNTGIVWSYDTYHGSAYFKWFSEIPERRQHHVT
jgi:hypothetical protein